MLLLICLCLAALTKNSLRFKGLDGSPHWTSLEPMVFSEIKSYFKLSPSLHCRGAQVCLYYKSFIEKKMANAKRFLVGGFHKEG